MHEFLERKKGIKMNREAALKDAKIRFKKLFPRLNEIRIEKNILYMAYKGSVYDLTLEEECHRATLEYLVNEFEITKKELEE